MIVKEHRMERLLDASPILPGLVLGPMPTTREFVRTLRQVHKVTAILTVQTNVDLLTLGYSWKQLSTMLAQEGIEEMRRVPIPDFDERSLALSLTEAVDALHEIHENLGHATYVHCTAGVNRSPTVVIAYLIKHQGWDLERAWSEVHQKRRVLPLRSALDRWLKNTRI